MKSLLICLSLLFISALTNPVNAQNEPSAGATRTLNITTTAEVMLPADLIQFDIVINAEAQTAQKAYEKHQSLEQALVSLLEQYNIDEKDIRFQPISVSEFRERADQGIETFYQTRQTVSITFSNFDIYEEIQISLIENGFDQFSGQFLTTQKEEGMNEALRKAIQKAQNTAELMAEAAGVELAKVLHIAHSEDVVRPYPTPRYSVAAAKTEGLLQYEQSVTVRATVSMEYLIES